MGHDMDIGDLEVSDDESVHGYLNNIRPGNVITPFQQDDQFKIHKIKRQENNEIMVVDMIPYNNSAIDHYAKKWIKNPQIKI